MSPSQIYVGIALTVVLAVACQILAARFRFPSILLLLPVGFAAGALVDSVNPHTMFGPAFEPLVSLAVAIILFDGGLELDLGELSGDTGVVVRRLLWLGIPITWGGAALFAGLLSGMSIEAAVMLGAILIVSGPTVVGPILEHATPGRRLTVVLTHEGTAVDPIGALIGVVVYQILITHHSHRVARGLIGFTGRLGIGLLGGAIGIAVLWILLTKMRLSGALAAEAILATVLAVAGLCDALARDTGLVAAIAMGMVIANISGVDLPEDRKQLKTMVQLTTGILFISISATVSPASLRGAIWAVGRPRGSSGAGRAPSRRARRDVRNRPACPRADLRRSDASARHHRRVHRLRIRRTARRAGYRRCQQDPARDVPGHRGNCRGLRPGRASPCHGSRSA